MRDDLLARAPNILAVRVHNSAAMGGIWRPVYLILTDAPTDLTGLREAETALGKEG